MNVEENLEKLSKELKVVLNEQPKWVYDRTLMNVKNYLSNSLVSKYNSKDIESLNESADVSFISNLDDSTKKEYLLLGEKVIKNSEFAYFIMAGGISTSMGGCAKAVVNAKNNMSFIEIKLNHVRQIQKKYFCKIPVILMTSQETDKQIMEHLNSRNLLKEIDLIKIVQPVTVRFTNISGNLEIAKTNNGLPSYVPGGHYDSFILLNEIKNDLKQKGIKTIFINNIDNLGATIDPVLLGCHILKKSLFTPEIAKKEKNDKGGTFARISGDLRLLEGLMVPDDYKDVFSNIEVHKYFNTNLIYLNMDIFEYFDEINSNVPVFINKKNFDGQEVFGFEGAVGLVFGLKNSSLLVVDRQIRFLPIKFLSDLWLLRSNFMILDNKTSSVRQMKLMKPVMNIPESFLANIDDFENKVADGGTTTDFSELESLTWNATDGKVGSNVKFVGNVIIEEDNNVISDDSIIGK